MLLSRPRNCKDNIGKQIHVVEENILALCHQIPWNCLKPDLLEVDIRAITVANQMEWHSHSGRSHKTIKSRRL